VKLAALLCLAAVAAFPAGRPERFVLILEDKPVAERISSRKDLRTAAASDARQKILAVQQGLRASLAQRGVRVISANQLLVNAVFVEGSADVVKEFSKSPGVAYIERLRPLKLHLARALDQMNIPAAWGVVNGPQNAGQGVKIAILDTGIDIGHPGFNDGSMQMPEGFPKCLPENGDCAYTNKKVIVARSYVRMLEGTDPESSRPDDRSPRDRVGHGTAVAMIAAGVSNTGPAGTIQGVAPGAWLGNYKVFGSPGVNGQYTTDAAVMQAIEDAVSDGMDIASISLGAPAVWGPLDRGSTCDKEGTAPCDWRAAAIQNATSKGLTVVVSAGNDGEFGLRGDTPTFNTIETPGTAPSAITVGAITNAHILYQKLRVEGSNAPANLRDINTRFGDGPMPAAPLTARVVDVARLGDDGKACSPLGDGALQGAIALIERGDCQQVTKVHNAYRAGAVAVVLYQQQGIEGIFRLRGLDATPIPTVLIGNQVGAALKTFLGQNADVRATLDPALVSVTASDANTLTTWTSRGPSIGENAMKPELVAVGSDIYTATQRFDPNGDMYDPTGYSAVNGTSFAAPMVSGVAAMVKQRNPGMTPAQIKSAVVNTADDRVNDYGSTSPASLLDIGAGRLDAAKALRTNVTAEPATVSFGIWRDTTPPPIAIDFRVHGTASVNLRVSIQRAGGSTVTIVPEQQEFTVGSQGARVAFRLNGNKPEPGAYEGFIQLDGGATPIKIPYVYFVPDGVLHNIVPLEGDGFVASAGTEVALSFKAIDRLGLPIGGLPVSFSPSLGNGRIVEEYKTTDFLGISLAWAELGDQLGEQEFTVTVGNTPNLSFPFWGRARMRPTIASGGVVNAASSQAGAVAPGSYITFYGRGLSEVTRAFTTPYLPLAISNVSVSFDVPSQNLSAPGRVTFVSDGQVNVQVPWELQGASSAQMKVSIGDSSSSVVTVQIASVSPAFFEYDDPSGRRFLAALHHPSYALVGSASPARKGGTLMLYANGLGAVNPRQVSGEVSPADQLPQTVAAPSVTIGGRPAAVLFSGLAPGFVGLYQINVTVAADTPSGVQPVVVTAGGVQSKAANIPVE
jgi:uncharacterized protein (TIGR03437 family)